MAAEFLAPSIIPMAEFARMLAEQALSAPPEIAKSFLPVSAEYPCNSPSIYRCFPWS
jgi:hypothetical protein